MSNKHTPEMQHLIDKMNNAKVVFGLEAQGHIPTIEGILARFNGHEGEVDMVYCREIWVEIGRTIGWEPFTAALYYFEYLKEKTFPNIPDPEKWVADMKAENERLKKEKEIMLKGLSLITEGIGRYNLDPLEHASNCIEDMIELAKNTIEKVSKHEQ